MNVLLTKYKKTIAYTAIIIITIISLLANLPSKQVEIKIEPMTPIIEPTPQNAEFELIERIANFILLNESSNGKYNLKSCEKLGKYNRIGYAIKKGVCFDTIDDEQRTLREWIDSHLKKMSIEQLLCHYETGKVENNCYYAKLFNKIK